MSCVDYKYLVFSRSLDPRYPSLRPFQRKIATLTTVMDLINSLDFLTEEQKTEIVSMKWKNSKQPIIAHMTSGRAQRLEEEIRTIILPVVEKLLSANKSHEQVCDEYVQKQYVSGYYYFYF